MTFVSGNIVNPFADARLKAGYSLQRLAKKLDVSKQYINRAERGTYRSVNAGLVNFACEELSAGPERIMQMYRAFQNAVRSHTALDVEPTMLKRGTATLPGNQIFTVWRECYWPSVTAFSNAWCIHPEIILAYEEGRSGTMPQELKDILSKYGLISDDWSEIAPTIEKVNVAAAWGRTAVRLSERL